MQAIGTTVARTTTGSSSRHVHRTLFRQFAQLTWSAMDVAALKSKAREAIDDAAADLNGLSQDIWKHPELAFEEHHSHQVLTDYLEGRGFQVQRRYHLETAFRASFGSPEKPHISVLCEYDALPEIGHACGHNLIAEVGVAAGLGIKAAMESAGRPLGKLTVLGTPAEEGAGGKIELIRKGAFTEMDVSLMAHPSSKDIPSPLMSSMSGVYVTFHGRASHAAAFPWEGVNALDAAVMTYNNVSCMRQQIKPTWRLHGIITNGGAQPNIIPEETQLHFYLRTPTEQEMDVLKSKFKGCVDAAATATGCKVWAAGVIVAMAEIEWEANQYRNLLSNSTILSLYEENCRQLGVAFPDLTPQARQGGSTDMGNLSYVVPSIHPKFAIGTEAAAHTTEFCRASGLEDAQLNTLRTAKALAMTAIDLYCEKGLLERAKSDLAKDLESAGFVS